MRQIRKPKDLAGAVFSLCIGQVQDSGLLARLQGSSGAVVDAVERYDEAAKAGALYCLVPTPNIGKVTAVEMEAVYRDRMAKKVGPGRPVYDRIMAIPDRGQCPLCAQRTVSTLDHHLPKKKFPALAVAPTNLVAACSECNKVKLARHPTTPDEQTLHPYFDTVEGSARWLFASVDETTPPAVRFVVSPPTNWLPALQARAVKHFEVFELAKLYGSHAAQEMCQIQYQLAVVYGVGGKEAVREHLRVAASSRNKAHANSWQAATYEALRDSTWFCDGGFQRVLVEDLPEDGAAQPAGGV